MLVDIPHELAVLEAFFAKEASWITTEYARLASASGAADRSNDQVEDDLFHPQGPGSVEELLCRMVINELNALVEMALQQAIVRLSGNMFVSRGSETKPTAEFVYSLQRTELEGRVSSCGISLSMLAGYQSTLEIKEISEGSKHRERLRPVPSWDKRSGTLVDRASAVPGGSGDSIDAYELALEQVSKYLADVRGFVAAIGSAESSAA